MVRIYSLVENEQMISLLNSIIDQTDYQIEWLKNEAKLYEKLRQHGKGIILLPESELYDVYKICSYLTMQVPGINVILTLHSEEKFDMKMALRAGASDVIFLTASPLKIKEDILTALSLCKEKQQSIPRIETNKNGKVITVTSTKGGVGKTTLAVNLAAALGKGLANVAIVDLDLQFGDDALFLDLKPKRTIYDWIKEDRNGKEIESFMTHYKDGIYLLAAPQRPEFAEVISGEDIRRAIQMLKKRFDVVIVDAASHMDENVLIALEASDDIFLMTQLDLPTLKNSKLFIDTLTSLGLQERVKIVVNRLVKVKGLTINTVEKVIGQKVNTVLPAMDKTIINSINEGKPLTYLQPRSQVAKRIFAIAENIYIKPNNKVATVKRVEGSIARTGGQF